MDEYFCFYLMVIDDSLDFDLGVKLKISDDETRRKQSSA